jgi:hypothetical protein
MKKITKLVVAATAAVAMFATPAGATTYKFKVSCSNGVIVDQWNTGAIDPGKEALRVSTGGNHPGCTVSDFNPDTDSGAPVEVHEGAGGVGNGAAGVVQIIKKFLGL